jgi:hypothetical protein
MKATALYNGEPVLVVDDTLLTWGDVLIQVDSRVEWVKFADLSAVRWIVGEFKVAAGQSGGGGF